MEGRRGWHEAQGPGHTPPFPTRTFCCDTRALSANRGVAPGFWPTPVRLPGPEPPTSKASPSRRRTLAAGPLPAQRQAGGCYTDTILGTEIKVVTSCRGFAGTAGSCVHTVPPRACLQIFSHASRSAEGRSGDGSFDQLQNQTRLPQQDPGGDSPSCQTLQPPILLPSPTEMLRQWRGRSWYRRLPSCLSTSIPNILVI